MFHCPNIEWVHRLPDDSDLEYVEAILNEVIAAWNDAAWPRGKGYLTGWAIVDPPAGQSKGRYLVVRFRTNCSPILMIGGQRRLDRDRRFHLLRHEEVALPFVECFDTMMPEPVGLAARAVRARQAKEAHEAKE